jgi:hypothetical protein
MPRPCFDEGEMYLIRGYKNKNVTSKVVLSRAPHIEPQYAWYSNPRKCTTSTIGLLRSCETRVQIPLPGGMAGFLVPYLLLHTGSAI